MWIVYKAVMFQWVRFAEMCAGGLTAGLLVYFITVGRLRNPDAYDSGTVRMFALRLGIGFAVAIPLLYTLFAIGLL